MTSRSDCEPLPKPTLSPFALARPGTFLRVGFSLFSQRLTVLVSSHTYGRCACACVCVWGRGAGLKGGTHVSIFSIL